MCVINFNIATAGTAPVSAEGRYRLAEFTTSGTPSPWETFNINLQDIKTPDITVNGNYILQVRVQYPDLSYSSWTEGANFKVGNCNKLGNLYVQVPPGTDPMLITAKDFNQVLYSSENSSGSTCYTPSVGSVLTKDTDLTIPVLPGKYLAYGGFNGCYEVKRIVVVGNNGVVESVVSAGLSTGN